jgi:hypothetical protein
MPKVSGRRTKSAGRRGREACDDFLEERPAGEDVGSEDAQAEEIGVSLAMWVRFSLYTLSWLALR